MRRLPNSGSGCKASCPSSVVAGQPGASTAWLLPNSVLSHCKLALSLIYRQQVCPHPLLHAPSLRTRSGLRRPLRHAHPFPCAAVLTLTFAPTALLPSSVRDALLLRCLSRYCTPLALHTIISIIPLGSPSVPQRQRVCLHWRAPNLLALQQRQRQRQRHGQRQGQRQGQRTALDSTTKHGRWRAKSYQGVHEVRTNFIYLSDSPPGL